MMLPAAVAVLAGSMTGAPAVTASVRDRIYPAPSAPLSLTGLPTDATLVAVKTTDGLILTGVMRPARAGMPTVLILHGNASSASGMIQWFAPLSALGYGIVAAEYRGYSGNPGTPDEAGLIADAEAFLALARQQAGTAPVYVVGHSLGGGVAFGLARRHRLDALFTIGTFTRLRALAPRIARSFVPDSYQNEAAVATLDEPWFLIHGLRDDVVPADEAAKLHRAATLAGRDGASFALPAADHHPDGALIAAIIEAARGKLATGSYETKGLPADVSIVPFGASKPIDR
ncbi:alpha/beta hydrolase [Sphingomonas sp. 28-63-12]|uniref:alpha/beta hydrolase n=1 Tax=Sphingomonas sp. 28-63-12 TaxID=1970434 RepID=UPI0035A96C4D